MSGAGSPAAGARLGRPQGEPQQPPAAAGGGLGIRMSAFGVHDAVESLKGNKAELLRPLADALLIPCASTARVDSLQQAIGSRSWLDVSMAICTLRKGGFLAAGFQSKFPDNTVNSARRGERMAANADAGTELARQWGAHLYAEESPALSPPDDAADVDPEEWITADDVGGAAPAVPSSTGAPLLSPSTHFMTAVPGSRGTILLAVARGVGGDGSLSTVGCDGRLVFYFYKACPLCRSRDNLPRDVKLAWAKEAGEITGGFEAGFTFAVSPPVLGLDGCVVRDAQGRPTFHKHLAEQVLFSWAAVGAVLRGVGGALSGQPGYAATASLREAVHEALTGLCALVLDTRPADFVRALLAGDAPFEGSYDLVLRDDGELVPSGAPSEVQSSAAAMSARQRIRIVDLRQEVLHGFSEDLHTFFCEKKTGLMYALNKVYSGMLRAEEEAAMATLRRAGRFSEEEIKAFRIPAGMLVLSTDTHIEQSAQLWDSRTGRRSDGRCIPLELLTSLELGRPSEEEMLVAMSGIVSYSQQRKNLYRSKVDRLMSLHSRQFFTGLDRPMRTLAHALGTSHDILDLNRELHGNLASKRMNKIMRASHAKASAVLNVAEMIGSQAAGKNCVLAWDNFVRNLKLGKHIGGSYGSYMINHYCHLAGKQCLQCDPVHGDGKLPPKDAPEASCWRCRGEAAPDGAVDATTATGASLCVLCAARPHVVVGDAEFATMKALLQPYTDSEGRLITMMHSHHLKCDSLAGEPHDDMLRVLALVTDSSASQGVFGATEAVLQIFQQHRRAMAEEQTYPMEHVESVGHTQGSRVLALAMKNTNSSLGLLGFLRLLNTHGLFAYYLDEYHVLMLADSKIYKIVERVHYMDGIDLQQVYKVIPRGVRGCNLLDSGLHVVGKYSEHLFITYTGVIKLLFNAVVSFQGTGRYPERKPPRLPIRLTLISLIFAAYDNKMRKYLVEGSARLGGDPAFGALASLLEQHVPLLMYYVQCFRLGRSTDISTRRAAFDLWLEKLLPRVIIQIDHVGSAEYGKILLQWGCKVLWYKANWPWMYHSLRDNFALVLDGEFIELIHSWVSRNFTRLDFNVTDFEQVVEAFLRKDWLQRAKSGLQETAGCAPTPVPRASRDWKAMEGDREQLRTELRRIVLGVSKEAEDLVNRGASRQQVVTAKGSKSQSAFCAFIGPVSAAMQPCEQTAAARLDSIRATVTKEYAKSPDTISASIINEFCKAADLKIKGTSIDELAKHFGGFRGAYEEEPPEEGTTRALHRQTQAGVAALSLRFAVTSVNAPKEMLFGTSEQRDDTLTAIINGLVNMLPGGAAAIRELRVGPAPDEIDWDAGLEDCVLGTRKMRIASMHLRRSGEGGAGGGGTLKSVGFELARGAAGSVTAYVDALRAADTAMAGSGDEMEEEEEAWEEVSVVCGELEVSAGGGKEGGARLLLKLLHERIERGMRGGAIRCLKLMAAGASEEATEMADRLADSRFGDATDVVAYMCNRALFTVIAACAQAVTAVFFRANQGGSGDMHLIISMLQEARLNIEEALSTTRPDGQPALMRGHPASEKLFKSLEATLVMIRQLHGQCTEVAAQAPADADEGD